MPSGTRKPPRGPQFRTVRHLEKRDTTTTKRARFNAPSQSEFGHGEYIDAQGRQYRLAFASGGEGGGWLPGVPIPPLSWEQRMRVKPASDGTMRLWVKLPKGKSSDTRADFFNTESDRTLELRPVQGGLQTQFIQVRSTLRNSPRSRGGSIQVIGYTS